jgi:hypothetical protein
VGWPVGSCAVSWQRRSGSTRRIAARRSFARAQ